MQMTPCCSSASIEVGVMHWVKDSVELGQCLGLTAIQYSVRL